MRMRTVWPSVAMVVCAALPTTPALADDMRDPPLSAEAVAARKAEAWDVHDHHLRVESAACLAANTGAGDCTTLLLALLERSRSYNALDVDLGPVDAWFGRPTVAHTRANAELAQKLALAAPEHVLARFAPADPFILIGEPAGPISPGLGEMARALRWVGIGDYPEKPDMMVSTAMATVLARAGEADAAAAVLRGPGLIKVQGAPEVVLGAGSRELAMRLNTQAVIAWRRTGMPDADALARAAAILAAMPGTPPAEAAIVNLNLARARQEGGDFESAEQIYRRWLPVLGKDHPGHAGVLVDRARGVAALGRGDEAMALIAQASAGIGADDAGGRLRAALIHADALAGRGRAAEAQTLLAGALAASSGTPAVVMARLDGAPAWLNELLAAPKLASSATAPGSVASPEGRIRSDAYRRHAQMLADAGRNDEAAAQVAIARKLDGWNLDAQALEAWLKVLAYQPVQPVPGVLIADRNAALERSAQLAADARTWLGNVRTVAQSDAVPAAIAANSGLGLLDLKTYGPTLAYDAFQRASKGARERIGAMQGYAEAERNELARYRDTFRTELIVDLIAARAQGQSAGTFSRTAAQLIDDAFVAAQWAEQTLAAAALGRVAARFAAGKSDLAALEREREALARQAETAQRTYIALLSGTDDEALAAREAAGARRDELASRLADLERRMAAADPAYADLTRPAALPIAATRALLDKDEALLMFASAPDATYVFAIARDGVTWHRSEALGEAALGALVDKLRGEIAGDAARGTMLGGAGATRPAAFERKLAHTLYRELVQPVETVLAGKTTVMTVASGALGKLPLALLVTDTPTGADGDPAAEAATHWLVDRYALTSLPAVSSLRALRCLLAPADERHPGCAGAGRRTAPAAPRADAALLAGFGAPALRGAAGTQSRAPTYAAAFKGALADTDFLRKLPSLPGSLAELNTITQRFPAGRAVVVTGPEATEARVKQSADLIDARYVVFSTHGLLSSESGIRGEPGLVLTPPAEAAKSDLDDGLLTASEAAALRLRAELVVLSACNTAASDGSSGGEGLSGLARGFFFAGARSLMVSHWPVSDAATSRLITGVFDRLQRKVAPAVALQQAMREVRADPRWAGPAFWAPFVLVGTGS